LQGYDLPTLRTIFEDRYPPDHVVLLRRSPELLQGLQDSPSAFELGLQARRMIASETSRHEIRIKVSDHLDAFARQLGWTVFDIRSDESPHASAERLLHDIARVPSDAYCKLLECCPIGKRQFEAGAHQAFLRIRGERHAGLPHLAQPLRPEPREVDEAPGRQQRLVGRDVRRRLLPPNVLLPGLQGKDIAAVTRGVCGLADDPPGHPPDELGACGQKAVMRAAVGDVVPRRLPFSDRKRADAALRESEARLSGIVGSAMDAIVSIDEARNIMLFNAAAEQMFRCSAAAVVGQSIDQFIPAHLRARHAEHVQQFGTTGVTSRSMRTLGELTAVRSGGDEFPIVISTERCTVCPLPVQDNVKDFDAVMLVMASLPEVALLPDHEPLAVHAVAPLEVHVSVELCPL